MSKNAPLTEAETEKLQSAVLARYSLNDFTKAKPNHFRAALAFIDLLNKAVGEESMGHVKLVPAEHVYDRVTRGHVAIIYEEICDIAEDLMGVGCGDNPEVEKLFYPKFKKVQEKYGVFFESITHWAAGIYDG